MAKLIVFAPLVAVFESRMAWRSDPGPLSAVVVTEKNPSVMFTCAWSAGAPSESALKLSVVLPENPVVAVKVIPSSAAFRAERVP